MINSSLDHAWLEENGHKSHLPTVADKTQFTRKIALRYGQLAVFNMSTPNTPAGRINATIHPMNLTTQEVSFGSTTIFLEF
jgi:hypothetical protein